MYLGTNRNHVGWSINIVFKTYSLVSNKQNPRKQTLTGVRIRQINLAYYDFLALF